MVQDAGAVQPGRAGSSGSTAAARIGTAVVALGLMVGSGLLPVPAAASEGSACVDYATYSIESLASGGRVVQFLSTASLISEVDSSGPSAHAQVHSIRGSIGAAGSPYSATAAENVGLTGGSANEVPVFARSVHPSEPEMSKDSPAFRLEARSERFSSKAAASSGGPAGDAGAAGSSRTSADAVCEDDGSVSAIAVSTTEGIHVAGVLSIASVRSEAEVTIDPSGERSFETAVAVEGVAVLGQPASITEEGLVLGPAGSPVGRNPLAESLEEAGVTVRFVEAVEDPESGEAIAPGIEISVEYEVPGASEPLRTTFIFGHAYAQASFSGVPPTPTAAPTPTTAVQESAPVPAPPQDPPTATTRVAQEESAASAGSPERAAPVASDLPLTGRLVNWSIAPAYYALALVTLLLFGIRVGHNRLRERFAWN